jgi:hypothetical protein
MFERHDFGGLVEASAQSSAGQACTVRASGTRTEYSVPERNGEASNALWLVPPRSALWIPGGVTHRIRACAPLEGYAALLEPDAAPNLPTGCCAVSVTPLFREVLQRLATRPALYDLDGPDARLVSVLLDELARVAIEKHRLPMPNDPRLRRLVDAILTRRERSKRSARPRLRKVEQLRHDVSQSARKVACKVHGEPFDRGLACAPRTRQ